MLILKEVRDVAQIEAEDIHSVRVDSALSDGA
jgi:hypothetical protein